MADLTDFWCAVNEHLTEEETRQITALWRIEHFDGWDPSAEAEGEEELFQLRLRRMKEKPPPKKKLECYHGGSLTSQGGSKQGCKMAKFDPPAIFAA